MALCRPACNRLQFLVLDYFRDQCSLLLKYEILEKMVTFIVQYSDESQSDHVFTFYPNLRTLVLAKASTTLSTFPFAMVSTTIVSRTFSFPSFPRSWRATNHQLSCFNVELTLSLETGLAVSTLPSKVVLTLH